MHASGMDELLPSRPVSAAVAEIVAMGFLGLFLTLVLGLFPFGNDGVDRAIRSALVAGAVVMQHIGWALGTYIPILLGFYAIVVGGQLTAEPATAARTRRTLGFTAELMTAALIPALALILATCIADPSRAGVLFVITPVAAVMFFLAVQLGGFIVFERELRLSRAKCSRDWARARLDILRDRSRKPLWLVAVVHTLVGGLIGTGTTLILTRTSGSIVILFLLLLYGLIALGLGFASMNGVHAYRTARDRMDRVLAWVIPSALYLVAFALAAELLATSNAVEGTSVLAVVAFSVASTVLPRTRASRFLVNWTILGAATAYAAKSVSKVYVRSMREVRELSQTPTAGEKPPLYDRIVTALHALRGTCWFAAPDRRTCSSLGEGPCPDHGCLQRLLTPPRLRGGSRG